MTMRSEAHTGKVATRGKKIVFVLAGLQAGGAEKVVNLIARHLAGQGHEVSVIAFQGSRESSYFEYPDGIRILTNAEGEHSSPGGWRRVLGRVRFLRVTLKQVQPDLIISFLTKVNVMTLAACLSLPFPIIIAERNNPLRQEASRVWQFAIGLLGRRAARLIMQTQASVASLPSHLQDNAVVIPNPAPARTAHQRASAFNNCFVAVGRLEKQKGFDLLLTAFAEVAKSMPNAKLTIFGEGPDLQDLENLAVTLNCREKVTFAGVTAQPGQWTASGDIFVLSSRYEGFPNVLLEAMSCGMPSIAFDCPWGPAEIITSGIDGLLVPEADTKALAAAMHTLLADANLRTRLSQNTAAAIARFQTDAVLRQWDSQIDSILR